MFRSNSNSDIKPHFKADFLNTLSGLYLAFVTSNPLRKNEHARAGFMSGISAFALSVGVNPAAFMKADDIELVKKSQNGEL